MRVTIAVEFCDAARVSAVYPPRFQSSADGMVLAGELLHEAEQALGQNQSPGVQEHLRRAREHLRNRNPKAVATSAGLAFRAVDRSDLAAPIAQKLVDGGRAP